MQRRVHAGELDAEAAYNLSKASVETQEAASEALAETEAVPPLGQPETTGNRKGKITRKAAKVAASAKTPKASKKALTAASDKTRSRDDVFLFFSGLAKPAKDAPKVKDAVIAIGKAVVAYMDGRASDKKLAGVLVEQTKGR